MGGELTRTPRASARSRGAICVRIGGTCDAPHRRVPRRLPIGTEPHERGIHTRVWAPTHERVTLVIEAPGRREIVLAREPGGYHAGFVPDVAAGARYRFRLGDDPALHADPASRFQPEGPSGPSQVIDPSAFVWHDAGWTGIAPERHVLYELHVGTFTPEGSWAAAAQALPYLAELGVTTLEIMPVNEFGGSRNWGYDGVNLFAPTRCYGTPDDMRRFVDAAHRTGLAVILDVVYNHFGPAGNSMFAWSPHYKGDATNDWGDALNFEAPGAREFFVTNAGYWIDEMHLDGLRLDATRRSWIARPSTCSPRSCAAPARPPVAGSCSSSPRTSRRTPRCSPSSDRRPVER